MCFVIDVSSLVGCTKASLCPYAIADVALMHLKQLNGSLLTSSLYPYFMIVAGIFSGLTLFLLSTLRNKTSLLIFDGNSINISTVKAMYTSVTNAG